MLIKNTSAFTSMDFLNHHSKNKSVSVIALESTAQRQRLPTMSKHVKCKLEILCIFAFKLQIILTLPLTNLPIFTKFEG